MALNYLPNAAAPYASMTDIGKFKQSKEVGVNRPRRCVAFFVAASIIITALVLGCLVLLLQVRESTKNSIVETSEQRDEIQLLGNEMKRLADAMEKHGKREPRKSNVLLELLKKRYLSIGDEFAVKLAAMRSILANCAMGMQSHDIQDQQISASSDYTPRFHGKYARLDGTARDVYYLGQSYGAWIATNRPLNETWIQVDLYVPRLVAGIVTQGRPKHYDQWVTSFKVSCGNSTDTLEMLAENGKDKIFQGNVDRNSKVINIFPSAKRCRYIRLHPQTIRGAVSLRMELLRGNCRDLKLAPLL